MPGKGDGQRNAPVWPRGSAAGLAVLDAMEREGLPENARKVGEYMKARFHEIQESHRSLGDVRGKGLVIGLEIVEPGDGRTPAPELTWQVLHGCAENGLLLGKVGLYGNVIRIAPPLVITEAEAELGISVIDKVLTKLS